MVSIKWTNEAEFWLKDIHDYISLDKKFIAKKVVIEKYTANLKRLVKEYQLIVPQIYLITKEIREPSLF